MKVYSKVPRLTVELLMENEEGTLFTLRNIEPKKGFWHLPGGTVLMDETVEEAVYRVAREELGVEIEIIKQEGYLEYYQTDSTFGHGVSLLHRVRITSGEIKLDDQASEYRYFKNAPGNLMPEYQSLFTD